MPTAPSVPRLRLRVMLDGERAFGPGKADLLEAIERHGSIAAGGRAMRMSYKRAWQLVDELNRMFAAPLVAASKGGGRGGGAVLTAAGRRVLAAYRRIETKARRSAAADVRVFARLGAPGRERV